jgi:hypothetical protein
LRAPPLDSFGQDNQHVGADVFGEVAKVLGDSLDTVPTMTETSAAKVSSGRKKIETENKIETELVPL